MIDDLWPVPNGPGVSRFSLADQVSVLHALSHTAGVNSPGLFLPVLAALLPAARGGFAAGGPPAPRWRSQWPWGGTTRALRPSG